MANFSDRKISPRSGDDNKVPFPPLCEFSIFIFVALDKSCKSAADLGLNVSLPLRIMIK